MGVVVLVTDRDLTVVGDPVRWTEVDATQKFNEPGGGSFKAAATPGLMAQVVGPGRRVVVIRDGAVWMAGPIETDGPYQWSAGGGEDADPGSVQVFFSDDLALVVPELIYPTPTVAATSQTAAATWTWSGNAEAGMRAAVNLNVGPGALVDRQLPQLALGAVASVGTSISYTARFEPLGDALRSMALAGGGLGFRTRQSGTSILFEVYAPADLSSTVRFSRGLRNLQSVQYSRQSPKTTVALVAGQGEGTARNIRERVNTTAITAGWPRLETFIDRRDTNVNSELDAAGDEELTTGGESHTLSMVTVDTPDQMFGRDYGLGDLVAAEPVPGTTVVDLVRAVQLLATPQVERVYATIGTAEATTDPAMLTQMRQIERRLARLEAT